MPTLGPLTTAITLASVAMLGYTAWYVLACAVWPFRRCTRCHATGRYLPRRLWPVGRGRNRFGRVRACRRCRGTGHHVRAGRRAWTWLRNEHHAGTHTPHPTTSDRATGDLSDRAGASR